MVSRTSIIAAACLFCAFTAVTGYDFDMEAIPKTNDDWLSLHGLYSAEITNMTAEVRRPQTLARVEKRRSQQRALPELVWTPVSVSSAVVRGRRCFDARSATVLAVDVVYYSGHEQFLKYAVHLPRRARNPWSLSSTAILSPRACGVPSWGSPGVRLQPFELDVHMHSASN